MRAGVDSLVNFIVKQSVNYQNTVRVYVIILLVVYEDILIPRNPGDGWRMRMQV